MKKKIAIIVIFVLCLVIPTITWPIGQRVFIINISEKRALAEFPEFSDSFISDFEGYFVDHAPYRSLSIKINSKANVVLGKMYTNMLDKMGISYYTVHKLVVFGEENWLFYAGDHNLDFYIGDNIPNERELLTIKERISKVANYFTSLGKEFYIYAAPIKELVYSEYMPRTLKTKDGKKRTEIISDYLKENSNINFIYPLQEIKSYKEAYQLYYKYDTHWNYAGGCLGTTILLRELGINYTGLELTPTEEYMGDLSDKVAIERKPDVNYIPTFNDYSNLISDKKCLFMVIHIHGKCKKC